MALNDLNSRINLVARNADDALIPLDDLHLDGIAFTMTNPPFYESEEAMLQSAKQKQRPPYTACTGSKAEMVTEGGELGFVNRIFRESLVLRGRVQWYTAMFGFLSSLTDFIDKLRENDIDNYAVTEFVQGNKTRRWAIAWSFQSMRPAQTVARGTKAALSKNILPQITEVEVFAASLPENIGDFASRFSTAIGALELISWDWNQGRLDGIGRAADKVWARAWRRRKKREMETEGEDKGKEDEKSEPECVFGFKVWIRVSTSQVSVGSRWLQGFDATAFESFRGFLKAVATSAAAGQESKKE